MALRHAQSKLGTTASSSQDWHNHVIKLILMCLFKQRLSHVEALMRSLEHTVQLYAPVCPGLPIYAIKQATIQHQSIQMIFKLYLETRN